MEQWAELRREHFVGGVSIKELARRDGAAIATRSGGRCARERAAGLSAGAGRVEAGAVQGRDPPAAAARTRSCRGSGSASCSSRWAARRGKTIVDDYLREVRPLFAPPPRTFQRTVYRPGEICQFDRLGAARGGAGRARPDAPRLGRRRVPGLLARRRRRAGLLQADRGSAGRDRRLPVAAGRRCRRRWSGIARPASTATTVARREAFAGVLRPAAGRLAVLRAGRSAGQGRRRAAAGLRGDQLRARPRVRERARLPGPARRLVRRRSTRARTRRCARARSTGSPRSAR